MHGSARAHPWYMRPIVVASIRPSSEYSSVRPKRPVYFVLVLTLVSIVALFGWTDGCQTIRTLQNPYAIKAAAERNLDGHAAQWEKGLVDALVAQRSHAWPLAVGQLLLGLLLWLTATALMFGRGQLRSLLLQALCAYGALLCVAYVLRAPLRAMQLEALLSGDITNLQGHSREEVAFWMRMFARGALAMQLGVLTAAGIVVTRPRVRAWLGTLRPPSGKQQDP
jgi:hypothetical protein